MNRYSHIARSVFGVPWAIEQSAMERLVAVVDFRMSGGKLDVTEIQEQLAAAAQSAGPRAGAQGGGQIAVIPIYGVLSYRMNLMSAMSGGTSVQQIQSAFRSALGDPSVSAIVFDVDSPGGSVDGIPELAAEIRAARGQKPIVAVANKMIASAAYWIAAQCDEIVAGPSSWIGSIGVIAVHEDDSAANEQAGVKYTYITAAKYKAEGNPDSPLSDETVGYVQSQIDKTYADFTTAVGKGRGLPVATIRGESFGEGRMKRGDDAVAAGMADVVDPIDPMIAAFGRLAKGKVAMRASAAHFMDDGVTVRMTSAGTTVTEGVGTSVADPNAADIAALAERVQEALATELARHAALNAQVLAESEQVAETAAADSAVNDNRLALARAHERRRRSTIPA